MSKHSWIESCIHSISIRYYYYKDIFVVKIKYYHYDKDNYRNISHSPNIGKWCPNYRTMSTFHYHSHLVRRVLLNFPLVYVRVSLRDNVSSVWTRTKCRLPWAGFYQGLNREIGRRISSVLTKQIQHHVLQIFVPNNNRSCITFAIIM